MAAVGEYAGRPLYSLPPHHRRPKAGPATQSLQRERNPKGSRWRLCALAGRGPPTEMQGKCRRCQAKEGDLRRKCGKSVGGAGKKKGTSDGNAGKLSEAPSKREGPPTNSLGICRRSFGCQGFRRSTFTKPLISWMSSTEARAFRRMSSVASGEEAASL